MLLPLAELRSDKHGVMQSWSQVNPEDMRILRQTWVRSGALFLLIFVYLAMCPAD